ncbi:MAG TPA: hypothetical protein VF590_21945 [Isosphaeraceae bacterium]
MPWPSRASIATTNEAVVAKLRPAATVKSRSPSAWVSWNPLSRIAPVGPSRTTIALPGQVIVRTAPATPTRNAFRMAVSGTVASRSTTPGPSSSASLLSLRIKARPRQRRLKPRLRLRSDTRSPRR